VKAGFSSNVESLEGLGQADDSFALMCRSVLCGLLFNAAHVPGKEEGSFFFQYQKEIRTLCTCDCAHFLCITLHAGLAQAACVHDAAVGADGTDIHHATYTLLFFHKVAEMMHSSSDCCHATLRSLPWLVSQFCGACATVQTSFATFTALIRKGEQESAAKDTNEHDDAKSSTAEGLPKNSEFIFFSAIGRILEHQLEAPAPGIAVQNKAEIMRCVCR